MQAITPPQAIIITAQALPDPAVDRAYSVIVLRRDQLQAAPTTQLDQLLKEVPGLQLFRRSDARSSHPTSQGVTLRGLGGNASSRALLTLDGVPQADPFGGWVNWPAYDPASLAEVRVARGGGSVASGPGALAGVIEMRSRRELGFTASSEAGSHEAHELRVMSGFALGGGTLGLSARGGRSGGFVPISADTRGPADRAAPYGQASFRGSWAAPLSAATQIQLGALGFTDRRERGLAFTGNRTDGADASVRLVHQGNWQWTALAYGQARKLRSSFASVSDGRATATRVALQDSVPSTALGGSFELRPTLGEKIELRLGGDVRRTEGVSRELYLFVEGEPTRRRRAGGETLHAGLFGEVTRKFGALTVGGGARLDRWKIGDGELFEQRIATGDILTNEKYLRRRGWLPTARISAVLEASESVSFTSAAYLSWRLPTLNELYRPFRAGADATAANPLLKPERLSGLEVGVRYRRGAVSLSGTAFANQLKDSIANVTLGEGPGVFPGVGFVAGQFRRRQNLEGIQVRGLEVSAEARYGPLSARAGASFTDAKIESDGSAALLDGMRPAQTPRVVLTGGIGWDKGGRSLSLVLRHVGPQFEDDLNRDKLPAATTLDAYVAWPITRRVQIYARGENLLDELIVAGIGSDGSVERATPRSFRIGISFRSDAS